MSLMWKILTLSCRNGAGRFATIPGKNTQDSVVNVDKLTYAGNLESLAEVSDSERYSFEHADICDAEAMARIFSQHQPDAVMHLAAESHVDR